MKEERKDAGGFKPLSEVVPVVIEKMAEAYLAASTPKAARAAGVAPTPVLPPQD